MNKPDFLNQLVKQNQVVANFNAASQKLFEAHVQSIPDQSLIESRTLAYAAAREEIVAIDFMEILLLQDV